MTCKRLIRCVHATTLVLWMTLALSAKAATITVNSNADSGADSLRNAIASANAGDSIKFGLDGIPTITLLSTLVVDKDLVIDGADTPNLTISGNQSAQVFVVNAGVTVTLANVAVISGYSRDAYGGGIHNKGHLTLVGSVIAGNRSDGGGGGGIYNDAFATASVARSNFLCNSAQNAGGAIYNRGILNVTGSAFTCNIAYSETGAEGGGIYNDASGVASLTNSTLANNMSSGSSGDSSSSGGGLYNAGSITALANMTFVGNFVGIDGSGGGIYNSGTIVALTHNTFFGNTSLTVSGGSVAAGVGIYNVGPAISLVNSIVQDCLGSVTDNGGNLDEGSSCGLSAITSKNNATLDLGPLTHNGGGVNSAFPGAGSDAIGRGVTGACSAAPVNGVDQRGAIRSPTACTSGAVEVGGQFELDVSVVGNGIVNDTATPPRIHCATATGPCHALYSADPEDFASVTLVASADAGSRFVTWSGDCAGAGGAVQATMTMNFRRNCTASFAPIASTAVAAPTLDRWAMLVLGVSLLLVVSAYLNRRPAAK